jgi:hypothetical protein
MEEQRRLISIITIPDSDEEPGRKVFHSFEDAFKEIDKLPRSKIGRAKFYLECAALPRSVVKRKEREC